MKNVVLLTGILISVQFVFSQALPGQCYYIGYTYDCNGERKQQSIVVTSCGNATREKYIDTTKSTPINIKVYPNPAQNILTVELGQSVSSVESIVYLYDLQGRVINSQKTNLNILQIDVSELNSGTYYLNVIQGKKHEGFTVMKSN